jgi:outer membrane receptor for ferrienterochelin and colicins
MMNHFLLLLSILGLSTFSYSFDGNIKDEEGSPAVGVKVAFLQNDTISGGTLTDQQGKFKSPQNIDFPIRINIEYSGYFPIDTIITDTPEYELSFRLKPLSKTSSEITVTGTMLPTTIKQSPVKTEVVSTIAMQDYLPGTTNMMETLKMVNGITEQVSCGVCFTNSISINGLPGPYTAVLLDGAPVFGNLATVYGLNGVPNVAVDKYEVIKGPNSTLYGSEALAGVINIITKNPDKSEYLADAVISTNDEVFANLSVSESIGNVYGMISGNFGTVRNIEDANRDGFNDMLNLDRYTMFTKWKAPLGDFDLNIGANLYYEDRINGVLDYVDNFQPSFRGSEDIYGESIITERYTFFASLNSKDMKYGKLDLSTSLYSQDSYYGSDHYQASQDLFWANYIYPISTENHTLLLGGTARYSTYNDNTQATVDANGIDTPDEQFIPGIFAQSEWAITDKSVILSGLRLDNYVRHGPILSPRLSFKWSPRYDFDFRLNTGTGFRVVNLFTEDHAFVTGQRQVLIEEELNPERSINALAGASYFYDLGIGWGTGSIDVDGFYTYFQNKIIPDYETEGFIFYSNTDGFAVTQGFAVNLNHNFDNNINITLGATFLESTETESNELGEEETMPLPYAPEYSGVAMVNYYWEWADLIFGYTGRLTGPQHLPDVFDVNSSTGQPLDSPRPGLSDAFMIHGIQITKNLEMFDIYVGMQNIGDFMQPISPLAGFNDPNALPGFSDSFDTAYAYSPIHGREFYFGIRAKM